MKRFLVLAGLMAIGLASLASPQQQGPNIQTLAVKKAVSDRLTASLAEPFVGVRTSAGVTEGLFGPTLYPAHGHLRPFVTLKGGFVDFRLSPSLIPYSDVVSTVLGIRTSSLNAALYPGGGAEASLGPIGLRLELGDAIYFNNGAHNNLRVTFGPIVRFGHSR